MKIVVLDGYTLNPGDLNWDGFSEFGDIKVYDRTTEAEIYERIKDAQAVLTNKTKLKKDVLKKLDSLKYIGVLATGYDVVDFKYASQKGITVTNVPDYSSTSVAQTVFAMILAITNRVSEHNKGIRKWCDSSDFSYSDYKLMELDGKSIGIVGFGNIGRKVSLIARAFGMKVLASTRTKKVEKGVEFVPIEELFKRSDIITLHCPLTEGTENLINENTINLMKETAVIVNTARGPLINEEDLKKAVTSGRIYGAALDVLKSEPPADGSDLMETENIYITPHVAWATFESRKRLMEQSVKNLKAYTEGNPVNVIG